MRRKIGFARSAYRREVLGRLFPRRTLRKLSTEIYNYHNLGSGMFPIGEEKTPFGSGERYNFDRMYMMTSSFDFTNKSVLDLGCNSGWFCIQAKLLGSGVTVGIDTAKKGLLGQGLLYALQFERAFRLGIDFLDKDLEHVDLMKLAKAKGLEHFDVVLLLSVLHHISPDDSRGKRDFFSRVYEAVSQVIFYEDDQFWNELVDADNDKIQVKGEGYRFGWNEDLSWQRRIHSIEQYEQIILKSYWDSWRREVLRLDDFADVRFLGFSEKRRPVLGLFKNPL